MFSRYQTYIDLIRLRKPIGTWLLLWPTLSALWISHTPPSLIFQLIFGLGALITRSAGCILNDLADIDIDQNVQRTHKRPLAAKQLSKTQAIYLLLLLAGIGFLLLIPLNSYCWLLAGIATIGSAFYPYCKRFFALPQLILGMVFNLGVLMAFAATQNTLPAQAWLLYVASVFWTLGYDTIYAIADKQEDLLLKIHSSAITFGQYDAAAVLIFYLLHLALWFYLFLSSAWHAIFLVFWLPAFAHQLWQYLLCRHRQPGSCMRAFAQSHWSGFFLLIGYIVQNYLQLG